MGKQYHYWPNGDAFDAWDVENLIDRADRLQPETVPLSQLHEIDTVYWFSDSHEPTVRNVLLHARQALEVDTSYPIILGPDGRVMDGMHRIARVLLEGGTEISAVRLPVLPAPDHTGLRLGEVPD